MHVFNIPSSIVQYEGGRKESLLFATASVAGTIEQSVKMGHLMTKRTGHVCIMLSTMEVLP